MPDVANLDIVVRIISQGAAGAAKARAEIASIDRAIAKSKAAQIAATSEAVSRFGRMQSSLRLIGSSLTSFVTIPLGIAAAASGVYAFRYEEAMQKVQGINRQTAASMDLYRNAMGAVVRETGRGPTELANALYFVTSASIEGAHAMDVLSGSAKGAAIGMGQTETVAHNVTTILKAYGEKNITAARIMDILTAAVRVGNVEADEFAAHIGGVVANAAHMKVEFEEVAAAIAQMTLKGISAAEAVTALNNFMLGLTKGTSAGAKYLQTMGTSYAELRKELADKGLIPTLQHIVELTKGNDETLKKIIPNIRSTRAVWGLLSGDAADLQRVFSAVANSTGEMDEAFAKWEKSATGKFRIGWAKLLEAAKNAGVKLIPIVTDFVNMVGGVVSAFSRLPKVFKDAALYLGLVLILAGPIATFTSTFYAFGRVVATARIDRLKHVATAMSGISGSAPAATSSLVRFSGIVGRLGVAGGALVATTLAVEGLASGLNAIADWQARRRTEVKGETDLVKQIYRQAGLREVTIDGVVYWTYEVKPKPKPKYAPGGKGFNQMMQDVRRKIAEEIEKRNKQRSDTMAQTINAEMTIPLQIERTQVAEEIDKVKNQLATVFTTYANDPANAMRAKVALEAELSGLHDQMKNLSDEIESYLKPVEFPKFDPKNSFDDMVSKVAGMKFNPVKFPDFSISQAASAAAAAKARSYAQTYLADNPLWLTVHGSLGGVSGGKPPERQYGGTITGPRSGYPVIMHGAETVVSHEYPERGLSDLIKRGLLGSAGGGGLSVTFSNCTFGYDPDEVGDAVQFAAMRSGLAMARG